MSPTVLKAKSEESWRAAILCSGKNLYGSSINRYYYSIFQFILHILDLNGRSVKQDEKDKGQHSHDNTCIEMGKLIESKKVGVNAFQFKSHFTMIKSLRTKADYHRESVDESELKIMERSITEMKTYLSKVENA